jgi:EAL domain-containing protein (putative c-di-GMP-specific phosphodiesterase class I)
VLSTLKGLGVRLAIDDFGTGYSSLSYLSGFPVDVLKIDRSFVASLGQAREQKGLVRSIVSLGRTLHLKTIAEGIEQPEQLAALRRLGADEGQGFYFARPLAPQAMAEMLATPTRLLGDPAESQPARRAGAA